jgi:hypothetical protein
MSDTSGVVNWSFVLIVDSQQDLGTTLKDKSHLQVIAKHQFELEIG